jgi:hypothetical protein
MIGALLVLVCSASVVALPMCRFEKNGDACGCLLQDLGCASARTNLSAATPSNIAYLLKNYQFRPNFTVPQSIDQPNSARLVPETSSFEITTADAAGAVAIHCQGGSSLVAGSLGVPDCHVYGSPSDEKQFDSYIWEGVARNASGGFDFATLFVTPSGFRVVPVSGNSQKLTVLGFCNPVLNGVTSNATVTIALQCCASSFCSSCGVSQLGTVGTCFSCLSGHMVNRGACEEPTDCKPVVSPDCAANHIGMSLAGSLVCAELDTALKLDGRVKIVAWRGATNAAAAKINFTNWLGAFDVPVLEQNSNGDGMIWALTLRRFVDRGGGVADPDRQDHIVVTAEEGCTSEITFFTLVPIGSLRRTLSLSSRR